MNRLFAKIMNLSIRQNKFYSMYAYNEEYVVSQYCKLHINCPFNIKIKPLDVHKYPDNNKLFIKFQSQAPSDSINYKFSQEKENVYITSDYSKPADVNCYIEAPVKSDLHITTYLHGSINVEKFLGDNLILNAENGDITSTNCQNSNIKFITKTGNIISNGTLHGANVVLETNESGFIILNHLQALKTHVKTQDGDVKTESCYSDTSVFETQTGKLMLNNVHKDCTVSILDCGILQMTGFDGTLKAEIQEGEADIQLTKLHESSNINVKIRSPILVRIAETVMDNTRIKTNCNSMSVANNITMSKVDHNENKNMAYFVPASNKYLSNLFINCPTCHLVLEEASWSDMFALNKRNF